MLIPFGTQSYQHEARQLSSQRVVNAFVEQQPEGSKSPLAVIRAPGIRQLTEYGFADNVRGGTVHKGKAWVVAGNFLLRVNKTALDTYSVLNYGTIWGNDRAFVFSNGEQLGVLSEGRLYIQEGATPAQEVQNESFSPAVDGAYLDLFGVFAKEDSNEFFVNDPGADAFPDLNEFNTLDFGIAEAGPGNIVALEADHRELFVFKETNTEVWTNTGGSGFPFSALSNVFIEYGTIAKDSVTKADNTIYWLANDMTVRRLDGYRPQRVSTHAIENEITKMGTRSDAIAFSYPYNGHIFYVLTFPSEGRTFVYDIATGLWSERETNESDWRGSLYLYAEDTHYIFDRFSGKVGEIDGQTYTDFGDTQIVSVTSPPIHTEGKQVFFNRLHVDFEMGRGITTGQGSDPQVMLQWSDDGGRTWSSEYWRSLGKTGEYTARAVWYRLGSSRDRVFRLSFSDPSPYTIIQAIADVEVGTT